MNLLVAFSCFVFTVSQAESARLLLVPFPLGSHFSWMLDIGIQLKSRGHEVCFLIGDIQKARKKLAEHGLKELVYNSKHRDLQEYLEGISKTAADMAFRGELTATNTLKQIKENEQIMVEEGRNLLLNNQDFFKRFERLQFDMAILDANPFTFYNYIIPYKYDIPYISITTTWDDSLTGVPCPFSIVPRQLFPYSNHLTFKERTTQAMVYTFFAVIVKAFGTPSDHLVARFAPEKPNIPLREIVSKSRLFIHDLAIPLDYPRPTLPNVILVPSLTLKEAGPLKDKALAGFIEGGEGFILFSFGSYIDSMPAEITKKFVEAFQRIQLQVIWKYPDTSLKVPKNVYLLPWIPQNDLLGHPKARLFITHCGNNGQYEALYHGVPMLGFPLFMDQVYNAARLPAKGYGMHMDILRVTTEELIDAIQEITQNKTYSKNTKLASAIMKDDPSMPIDKVIYWIEHVMKFGSDHLRSAAITLPWYQYWMMDIFVFLATVALFFAVICLYACKCCLKFLCEKNSDSTHKKKD